MPRGGNKLLKGLLASVLSFVRGNAIFLDVSGGIPCSLLLHLHIANFVVSLVTIQRLTKNLDYSRRP